MAALAKRSLPAKVQAMKTRKRQKLDQSSKDTGPAHQNRDGQIASNTDKLRWSEVDLPDRLDDYEGFFGLEEIDGIQVLKDDNTGTVQYISNPSNDTALHSKNEDATQESRELGDDWDGFDEHDLAPARSPASKVKPSMEPSVKKSDRRNGAHSETLSTGTAFEMLQDEEGLDDGDLSAWQSIKLSPDMMSALRQLNFTKPTPIQSQSIPAILDGRDVIGKASTGSGKTLAFGIPIVDRFLERQEVGGRDGGSNPFALVLSPTRELAHQLEKHISSLTAGLHGKVPFIVCLTGGLSLQKQQRLIKDADIIIATPGRLWELIGVEKGFGKAIQQIQFLVLDEADRLLSEGHFKELEEILNTLERIDDAEEPTPVSDKKSKSVGQPKSTRQTLVFSATFDKSLHSKLLGKGRSGGQLLSNKDSMEYLISKLNLQDMPQLIDVNPVKQLAIGLREGLIECGAMDKDLYLYAILLHHPKQRVMVFTNSISAVRRLTPFLQNLELPAIALHSGMPQKARLRSVERLAEASKQSKSAVLVTTDVAARGLDIPDVEVIIHYNLPRAADTYVHRSGRTARAGKEGSSIIICSPEEASGVRKLVARVHAQYASAGGLSNSQAKKQGYYIRTMDPDRKIATKLKARVALAKKLADVVIAKEKQHKEDEFMQAAAEELGIDYDSDEFQKQAPGRAGRGSGRKQKEKQAQTINKAEMTSLRAELRQLLQSRINAGVSETYITSGKVDVADLLAQQEKGGKKANFLGTSSGYVLDLE